MQHGKNWINWIEQQCCRPQNYLRTSIVHFSTTMVNVRVHIATTVMPKQVNSIEILSFNSKLIETNLVQPSSHSPAHRKKLRINARLKRGSDHRFDNTRNSIVGTAGASIRANAETHSRSAQRKWIKNDGCCSNCIARTSEKTTKTWICAATKTPSWQCIDRTDVRSIDPPQPQRWIRAVERFKRNGWFGGHQKRIDIDKWNNTKQWWIGGSGERGIDVKKWWKIFGIKRTVEKFWIERKIFVSS